MEAFMDILAGLNTVFRKLFEDESLVISRSTTAHDIEDWDSITHMVLITAVEQKYSIKFTLADLTTLNNVGDMVDIVASRLEEKGNGR